MASVFDTMAANGQNLLARVMGETATYRALGTGTPATVTVVVASEDPALVLDGQGQIEDRVALFIVPTASVATPKRTDTYTMTNVAQAGTWTQIREAKRDNVRWLVAVRLMSHNEFAAPGAREIR